MEYFVSENNIIKKIWGKADTVLLIFAGAAAEFALNKSVDWLYFTGRLPSDPIGRLFSTVGYARQIIFLPKEKAIASIEKIKQIHKGVENARGTAIPDWAYRDVLFMLIHYSIAAFETLERKLTIDEKEEVFSVFYEVGCRMELKELPGSYNAWQRKYEEQLQTNLAYSNFTADLFKQYKKHLGSFRYFILIESQKLIVNNRISTLLRFSKTAVLRPTISIYKLFKKLHADAFIQSLLIPRQYKVQVKEINTS